MISNKLTIKQKEDLKKFVDIAYENKRLWLSKEGFPTFMPLSNPEYFGDKINLLNSIFINFPLLREEEDVNDDFIMKEMRWVLQIITDDERMKDFIRPSLPPETPDFTIKFYKQEDIVSDKKSFVEDSIDLNTQSLLDTLGKILDDLKIADYKIEYWDHK